MPIISPKDREVLQERFKRGMANSHLKNNSTRESRFGYTTVSRTGA